MGGSSSKDVQENSNFNLAEYNRRVASSGIYTNNPMNLSNDNQYHFQENGVKGVPMVIQESSVNKLALDFLIVKNSLNISRENETVVLSLRYVGKKDGELRILFLATETGEGETGIPVFEAREELRERVQGSLNEVSITRRINVSHTSLNLDKKNLHNFYPFVVILGNHSQKLYTYARPVNNFQDTVIIKQKIENEGKAFFLQQVFGLSKNSEERLCIICFSEQSEVSIFPCGHMCLCFACCGELMRTSSNCPICREKITSYERIKGVENGKP